MYRIELLGCTVLLVVWVWMCVLYVRWWGGGGLCTRPCVEWTVSFCLTGEGDGKAKASVPAVPSAWAWSSRDGAADDQRLQRWTDIQSHAHPITHTSKHLAQHCTRCWSGWNSSTVCMRVMRWFAHRWDRSHGVIYSQTWHLHPQRRQQWCSAGQLRTFSQLLHYDKPVHLFINHCMTKLDVFLTENVGLPQG